MFKIYYCDTKCINEFKTDIKNIDIAKAIAHSISMSLNTISFVYDVKNKEIICDINCMCIKDVEENKCHCDECHCDGNCECNQCDCDKESA